MEMEELQEKKQSVGIDLCGTGLQMRRRKPVEASRLARIIANLPEKKEVKEN